jgi:hypothetical protein
MTASAASGNASGSKKRVEQSNTDAERCHNAPPVQPPRQREFSLGAHRDGRGISLGSDVGEQYDGLVP